MRTSRLAKQVAIETAVETQTSTGAVETSWTTLARVYAEIKPLAVTEGAIGGGILAEATTKITVRWAPALASLSAKSRITHSAAGRPVTVYNIVGPIEPDIARGVLELLCKSGVNEG